MTTSKAHDKNVLLKRKKQQRPTWTNRTETTGAQHHQNKTCLPPSLLARIMRHPPTMEQPEPQRAPTPPQSDKQCGMCGACNAMPPWAPEQMAKLTPHQREALQARMQAAQHRFIEHRDAHLAQSAIEDTRCAQPAAATPPCSPPSTPRATTPPILPTALPRADKPERASSPLANSKPARPPTQPASPLRARPPLHAPSGHCLADLDSDAESFHTADGLSSPDLHARLEDLNHPVPDLQAPVAVRAAPTARPPPADNGGHSRDRAQPGHTQASSPPAHTASESPAINHVNHVRRPAHDPRIGADVLVDDLHVLTLNGLDGLDESVDGLRKIGKEESTSINSTENLEDVVQKRREAQARPKRRPSPPPDMADVRLGHMADDSVISHVEFSECVDELVGANVVECSDCQVWRKRVQELETKVDTLTSGLAVREMEMATLRARVGDGDRYVPRSEARLLEECESLRVTTEFLVSFF